MSEAFSFAGLPLDVVTRAQALEQMDDMVQSRRFHHVVTANSDFLVHAIRSADFRRLLARADLVLPDGMPLVWLLRCLGQQAERVTGADLLPAIAALAERRRYRLFLLGSRPEVTAAAAARLQHAHPDLPTVAAYSPPFSAVQDYDQEVIIHHIDAAQPDILLVALGAPKQEEWIDLHRARLKVPLCMGIGGALDFLSGFKRRAPASLQAWGLEWLFRLGLEPRRLWRRYLTDGVYLMYVAALLGLSRWRNRNDISGHLVRTEATGRAVVEVHGTLTASMAAELVRWVQDRVQAGPTLHIDVSRLYSVDPRGAAHIVRLAGRYGQRVSWQQPRGWLSDWLGLPCLSTEDAFSSPDV